MHSGSLCHKERAFWYLLAAVAVMGIVFMPREMTPGDPFAVREETRAILLHGELALEPSVAKHYAQTQERGQYVVENPNNGRTYSKYGSMLALAYVLPMAVEWCIEGELPVFESPRRILYLNAFNVILTLLIAASLYRTSRRFGATPWIAATYVALCFYATFLWNHLRIQSTDIFQLLCFAWAASAFLDVLDARAGATNRFALARMWAACAAMLLTKVSYIFVGPMFAVALLADRLRRSEDPPLLAFWKEARLHAAPALLAVTILACVNWTKFGAPWFSGYHVWRAESHLPFKGDLGRALFELAFSARWGLPYLFPILLLAIPWMASWVRRYPAAYGAILGISVSYTILIGSLVSWRGEMGYGPRYWVFSLPLVSLPAIEALRWLARRQTASMVAAIGVACVLGHSVLNQMAVNRHSFFAYYYLLGPLDNALGTEAAEFFLDNSYGDVIRSFESRFPDLPWWTAMQPKIRPDAAGAYETHVRRVLSQSNLYWFP